MSRQFALVFAFCILCIVEWALFSSRTLTRWTCFEWMLVFLCYRIISQFILNASKRRQRPTERPTVCTLAAHKMNSHIVQFYGRREANAVWMVRVNAEFFCCTVIEWNGSERERGVYDSVILLPHEHFTYNTQTHTIPNQTQNRWHFLFDTLFLPIFDDSTTSQRFLFWVWVRATRMRKVYARNWWHALHIDRLWCELQ